MLDKIFEGNKLFWGFLTHGLRISGKKFIAVILLFFPSIAWFYLFDFLLIDFIASLNVNLTWQYIGKVLFYISIVSSAIIGSMVSEKWNRRRFLEFWIFLGVITTAFFAFAQGLMFFLILGVLAGISFGLGFPSSLAFLADSTGIEERARVSGALILITFISLILTIGVITTLQLGLIAILLICIILRAISFFALLIDPCERIVCRERGWRAVLITHGFWLYFLSWLMFSVAGGIFDFIKLPQSLEPEKISMLASVFLYVGVVLSSLISGFVSDRYGRKKPIIFGLITLGISYAFFSIATSPISYLLTRIIYGTAWGIIFVTYMLTVIGDFARTCSKEKFYAIGVVVPLIVFMVFQSFSDAFSLSISTSIFSSILSMILFISVVPLLYAPETLPKDKIRRRRVEEHLKKVKKLVEEEKTRNHN